MKCDKSVEILSGYLDGELDPEHAREIAAHIKHCASCQRELAALRSVDELVKKVEVAGPSREFFFGINRKVMDRVRKQRRFSLFRFAPVLVPVAITILVAVIIVNAPHPARLVSINDRVTYTEMDKKEDIEVTIPELSRGGDAVVDKPKSGRERIVPKKESPPSEPAPCAAAPASKDYDDGMLRDVKTMEKAADVRMGAVDEMVSGEMREALSIPQDRIVRAIVDSNGQILKVATGNTIIPEEDTMLENRLKGQQVMPPMVAGKRKQLYVDFTQEAETTQGNEAGADTK